MLPHTICRVRGRLLLAAAAILAVCGCQSVPPPKPPLPAIRSAEAVFSAASSSPQQLATAQARYAQALGEILAETTTGEGAPRLKFDRRLSPAYLSSHTPSDVIPARRPRRPNPALERAGIGLPVVAAIGRGTPNAPSFGYRVPLTLLAGPGNPPSLVPADPLRIEDVRQGRRSLPLARNLYAPLRILESSGPRFGAGLVNLLRVDRFSDPRLVFVQPYDPKKIPVVLVHGLVSTPRMWGDVVRELWEDPDIRQHFQFWVFYYPTGQPVPLSALQLREALDAARLAHRVRQPMILIGHSMGGILSRAQVAGISEAQAEEILPGVTSLPRSSLARRALIFQPRTDIARVIYIATPHRGSPKADSWPARASRGLIRLPGWVRAELSKFLDTELLGGSGRIPTSIDGLSPRSRFLNVLDRARMRAPAHSIIGDRGRGDGERSSDGIVPFFSAHLPDAESELLVPADHGAHVHPESIRELRRILHLHVDRPGR